jgi:hypothetical protein
MWLKIETYIEERSVERTWMVGCCKNKTIIMKALNNDLWYKKLKWTNACTKGRRGPTFVDYVVKAKSIRETIPKGRGKDSNSFDRSPTPKE